MFADVKRLFNSVNCSQSTFDTNLGQKHKESEMSSCLTVIVASPMIHDLGCYSVTVSPLVTVYQMLNLSADGFRVLIN